MNHQSTPVSSQNGSGLTAAGQLKLIKTQPQGTKIELTAELLGAIDAALAALTFQHQVRLLMRGETPHALEPRRPSAPRPVREQKERTDTRNAPPKKDPSKQADPWSSEQEALLKSQWDAGTDIQEIAKSINRAPNGVIAKMIRMGLLESDSHANAMRFLIRAQQLVVKSSGQEIIERAKAVGFDPEFKAKAAPKDAASGTDSAVVASTDPVVEALAPSSEA